MGARRQVGGGYPVAPKVAAASTAAATGGFVLWLLQSYVFHGDVPQPVQAVIDAAVPAVLAFVVGWVTRHQQRDSDAPIVPIQPPTL